MGPERVQSLAGPLMLELEGGDLLLCSEDLSGGLAKEAEEVICAFIHRPQPILRLDDLMLR